MTPASLLTPVSKIVPANRENDFGRYLVIASRTIAIGRSKPDFDQCAAHRSIDVGDPIHRPAIYKRNHL